MSWSLLLLIAAVAAIVWIVRGRRPAPPPPQSVYHPEPSASDWGRQPPPQAQQPGISGQVMGGLATGLALGAGVVVAQEVGRHMMGEHGQHGAGGFDDQRHAGGSAADSSLARDAGLGSVGAQGVASWDDGGFDAGGFDDGGGGGGDGGD